MNKIKLPLPKDSELSDLVVDKLNRLPNINVFRMVANAPQMLTPFVDMVQGLYNSKVDIRLREIAILRQASQAKSEYELHQHKFIASANGITDKEISLICSANKVSKLSELENTICQMSDEL